MDRLPKEELHRPYFFQRVHLDAPICRNTADVQYALDADAILLQSPDLLAHEEIVPVRTSDIISGTQEFRRYISASVDMTGDNRTLPEVITSMPNLTALVCFDFFPDERIVGFNKLEALSCKLTKAEHADILARALQSPLSSLQRLEILGSPDVKDCDLVAALAHPNCKIWDLTLHEIRVDLVKLSDSNWKLRKLSIRYKPWEEEPLQLPKNRPANLEHLSLHFADCNLNDVLDWLKLPGLRSLLWQSLQSGSREAFCRMLRNPECSLESLILTNEAHFGGFLEEQQEVLDAISSNYHSRLTYLIWNRGWLSPEPKARWEHLQRRAQLFTAEGAIIVKQNLVSATTAKLFVCGHARVGKTTLTRNLCRKWFSCIDLPSCLQMHNSTVGMDIHRLKFSDSKKKLIICDLAGQTEYHAFHHQFVRGSDRDLFIVLCKLGGQDDELENSLRYWLRFIVAHQSPSPNRKPKVLVAVNDFWGEWLPAETRHHTIDKIIQQFSPKHLDILGGKHFRIIATKSSSLSELKTQLELAFVDLLQNRAPIPEACDRFGKQRVKIIPKCTGQKQKIVSFEELAKAFNTEGETKFNLACLHDIGKAIYFGMDVEEEDILSTNVILDVQWFVREVVNIFMNLRHTQGVDGTIQTNVIRRKLLQSSISEDQLLYVLKSLHHMGFLVPLDEECTRDWYLGRIVVPALLDKPFLGWKQDNLIEEEHLFWGRRLDCEDKVSMLLPSGVFAKIQVHVKDFCKNRSFKLGDGWVSFRENGIGVVVHVGGSTNSWMDRHWVDIMLTVPRDEKKCFEADKMMKDIKVLVTTISQEGCPMLKLEEKVIDPKCAQDYIVSSKQNSLLDESMVETLQNIIGEVKSRGLDYTHSWPGHDSLVADLLMPSELQEHLDKWKSLCEDYSECIIPQYETPVLEKGPLPEFENNDMNKLVDYWEGKLNTIAEGISDIKIDMNQLKSTLKVIQSNINESGKKIMMKCSKILLKLNVECPRYPYLRDKESRLSWYSKLITGEQVCLHYLCEHVEGGHQVEETCEGVDFAFELKWYRKHIDILGPAFDILYFAAKLGTCFIPIASGAASTGIDLFKSTLIESRQAVFGSEFNRRQPTKEQIEELFEFVLKLKKQEYLQREPFVKKYFGLSRSVRQGGEMIWVCEKHLQ